MTFRHRKMALRLVKDMTQRIEPDAQWMLRTRERLLQRVQRSTAVTHPASLLWKARAKEFLLIVFPGDLLDVVRGPVMAVLSVIGLVLGGSIASVSASERSIPGDLLYPVKLATEQARVLLEKQRTEKVKLKTEFAARRVEEIKALNKTNDPKKPEHIKEAVDILKNDLDTVKTQLHEANEQAVPGEAAQTAKLVDQKSTELASALKEVKADLPEESKAGISEAESAVVSTGVKAVQILIESHQSSDGKDIVTAEEIKQSITNKVQGLEAGIADVASKVMDIGVESASSSSSTPQEGAASTTLEQIAASSTSTAALLKGSMDQLKSARDSLAETKQLLDENKIGELKDKLGEVAKAVNLVEKTVGEVVVAPAQLITSDQDVQTDVKNLEKETTSTSTHSEASEATSTETTVSTTIQEITKPAAKKN